MTNEPETTDETGTTDEPDRTQPSGWFRRSIHRIALFLRGPVPVPPQRPGRSTIRQDAESAIPVTANGGVFEFRVFPSYQWHSDGLTPDHRDAWIRHYLKQVRAIVRQHAADLARDYYPHQADRLEADLNEDFGDEPVWTHHRDDAMLECRVYVRIRLDERVQAKLEPLWERRVELQCRHEVEMLRATLVKERSQQWLAVLGGLQNSSLAAGAAALTENGLAEVVRRIVTEEKTTLTEQINLLKVIASTSDGLAAYEIAQLADVLTDTLRRRLQPEASQLPEDSATTMWSTGHGGNGKSTSVG